MRAPIRADWPHVTRTVTAVVKQAFAATQPGDGQAWAGRLALDVAAAIVRTRAATPDGAAAPELTTLVAAMLTAAVRRPPGASVVRGVPQLTGPPPVIVFPHLLQVAEPAQRCAVAAAVGPAAPRFQAQCLGHALQQFAHVPTSAMAAADLLLSNGGGDASALDAPPTVDRLPTTARAAIAEVLRALDAAVKKLAKAHILDVDGVLATSVDAHGTPSVLVNIAHYLHTLATLDLAASAEVADRVWTAAAAAFGPLQAGCCRMAAEAADDDDAEGLALRRLWQGTAAKALDACAAMARFLPQHAGADRRATLVREAMQPDRRTWAADSAAALSALLRLIGDAAPAACGADDAAVAEPWTAALVANLSAHSGALRLASLRLLVWVTARNAALELALAAEEAPADLENYRTRLRHLENFVHLCRNTGSKLPPVLAPAPALYLLGTLRRTGRGEEAGDTARVVAKRAPHRVPAGWAFVGRHADGALPADLGPRRRPPGPAHQGAL